MYNRPRKNKFSIDILPRIMVEYGSYQFLEGFAKELMINIGWFFWDLYLTLEWGDESQIDEPLIGSNDFDEDTIKPNTGEPWMNP